MEDNEEYVGEVPEHLCERFRKDRKKREERSGLRAEGAESMPQSEVQIGPDLLFLTENENN